MARTAREDREASLDERIAFRATPGERAGLDWLVRQRIAELGPSFAHAVNHGVIMRELLNRELDAKGWPPGGDSRAAPPAPREYPQHEPPQLRVTEAAPGERIVELDEAPRPSRHELRLMRAKRNRGDGEPLVPARTRQTTRSR